MVAIFEHRKIEKNDFKNKLKFPGTAILTNLSPDDYRNLSSGQNLVVQDDQGATHRLTVKKIDLDTFFTEGWTKFRQEKKIKKDDEISFCKEEGYSSGAQYIIKVKRAN